MTYTVREPGHAAWEQDIATMREAVTSRGQARDAGLRRAGIVDDESGEWVPEDALIDEEEATP